MDRVNVTTDVSRPRAGLEPVQTVGSAVRDHARAAVAAGVGAEARSADPSSVVLLGLVSRRHYLEGRSKTEIADELGISRFKVARLLEEARTSGVVRIEVVEDLEVDVEASVRLRTQLGVEHVVVTTPDSGGAGSLDRLGDIAARFISGLVTADDVLGLPWSRTVDAMVRHLRALPPVTVVQLCGAQPPPGDDSSAVGLVVAAARAAGTRGHVFFTPLLVADATTATALRKEPQVHDALHRAADVTVAVVGVGSWGPGLSTVYDGCDEPTRTALHEAGVVGEIAGVTFAQDGSVVATAVADRLVSIDATTLASIPRVIAIARGAERADAVRAACRGGLVNGLVVDADLAAALLERT